MKKQIFTVLAATIISISVNSQNTNNQNIPSVILNAFNSKYPNATDIDWELDGTLYHVEFETDWNTDHDIWFNTQGAQIKHVEDITTSQLPEPVVNKLLKDFGDYSIDDLERITNQNTVAYKLEVKALLKQDYDIIIDAKGKILSKIAD